MSQNPTHADLENGSDPLPTSRQGRYFVVKVVMGLALAVLLYFMSRANYPLFHSIADMVTVFIAGSVFLVVWNGRRHLDNHYYLFIAIAFLAFALLDFMHLIGNKGMGVFPQYGSLGPTFYIAGRYVLGVSFLLAPLFIKRKVSTVPVLAAYLLVVALVLLSVLHWRNFPTTYIEGTGLTPFKVYSDYLVCLMLLGGLRLLLANRQAFDARVLKLIALSLLFSIASGLAFTLYTDAFGIMNALGHFFQIISFYLVFLGFVDTVLTRPHNILYRNLQQSNDNVLKLNSELEHLNRSLSDDIAARKQAEDALRTSEKKLSAIYASMTEGLALHEIIHDQSGIAVDYLITEVNSAYEKITGLGRSQTIGKKASVLYGTGEAPYLDVYAEVASTGISTSFDAYFGPMQKHFHISVFSPAKGAFATTFQDISDRKQAEESLRQLNETLEQRVAERTAEVRQLADHLRALATDLAQTEQRERKRLARVLHDHIQQLLVAARIQLTLIGRATSEAIPSTVQRADSIIQEALDASQSLTVELSPPILHEAGLIGGLNWLAARALEKNQLEVVLRAENKAEPPTEDVRFLLFECVRELLLNAVKHSGVAQVHVTLLRTNDGFIKLIIRDEGKGFDPDLLKNRRPGQASFGLFSIQQRLAHISGQMEIATAPGKGTRITLAVPVGDAQTHLEESEETVRKEETTDRNKVIVREKTATRRVLIVDDHRLMREGLARLFEFESDIEVVGQAANGPEAIALAEKLEPDVVLMDVSLGEMNGVEATRKILAADPEIKVIGLSMHVDKGVANAMREAGAVAYLSKSGPSKDLIEAIRTCRRGETAAS